MLAKEMFVTMEIYYQYGIKKHEIVSCFVKMKYVVMFIVKKGGLKKIITNSSKNISFLLNILIFTLFSLTKAFSFSFFLLFTHCASYYYSVLSTVFYVPCLATSPIDVSRNLDRLYHATYSQRVWQRYNNHGDRIGRRCWWCLYIIRFNGIVLQVSN